MGYFFKCCILLFIFLTSITGYCADNRDTLNVEIITVVPGSTLLELLLSQGIERNEVYSALKVLNKIYNVNNLPLNKNIELMVDGQSRLMAMNFFLSNLKKVNLKRYDDNSFYAELVDEKFTRKLVRVSSIVQTSLFSAVANQGVPDTVTMSLIKIYDNIINLKHSIKPSDSFEILFEQFFDKYGNFSHNGAIVYASLNTGNKTFDIYQYRFSDNTVGYFDNNGKNVDKTSLSSPISKKVRISSPFGWRIHPTLRYSHFHRGVDFAVNSGSPIYSAGDGIMEFIGTKGGYGKYIKIKHIGGYSTAYGHLSRFNKKLRNGSRVHRGQLIGYSGSTGRATGPHLHYEVLYKGKPVDPMKFHAIFSKRIDDKEMHKFKQFTKEVKSMMQGDISYADASINAISVN